MSQEAEVLVLHKFGHSERTTWLLQIIESKRAAQTKCQLATTINYEVEWPQCKRRVWGHIMSLLNYVSHILLCFTCLVTYVLYCPPCLVPYMLSCLMPYMLSYVTCHLPYMPYMFLYFTYLLLYVLLCLLCFVLCVPLCLACLVCLTCLLPLCALLLHMSCALRVHVLLLSGVLCALWLILLTCFSCFQSNMLMCISWLIASMSCVSCAFE